MNNTIVEIDAERGSLVAQENGTTLHFVLLVPEVTRFQLGDVIAGDLRFIASMGSGVITHGMDPCLVVCRKGTCLRESAFSELPRH